MTDKQPETNELCRWFDEEDGFKQGTAAPHKWVLQANSEIHRLQARVQELEAEPRSGRYAAAVRTLTAMGYTWGGGEQWKPPIGHAPDFNLIDSLRATNTKLEADLVAEAGRTAELKLRANQMAEQHRMQAAMNADARAELAEEKEATDNWRRLALQFDGHRMQAVGYLKALLKGQTEMETGARMFIASPPIPGEQVLAERIAALAGALAKVQQPQKSQSNHSPEAGKMVACACGDQFPVDSYGAGFVDAKGKCFGCDAESEAISTKQCWCTTCRPITMKDMRFVICPQCGNKRCPHAHNHALACTGSNAVGQPGSSWEGVKPITKEKQ